MESLSNAQSPLKGQGVGEAYDGFLLESGSMPLARIISRVYRGLSSPKRQILTTPLKRMRAEGDVVGLAPKDHVAVDVGGGFEVRKKVDPKDLPNLPDLKLDQGGLMLLLKVVRVPCNAWALCGADLVEHPTEKSGDGSPQKGPEHSFVASPALA